MAIAKLLGFDLCPRLRDLAERKLYLPRGFSVPDGLGAVTVRRVSLAAIERGWDELLRLAASIRSGRVSAMLALQRFGSATRGDPLHRAAEHLSRLLRTVFLCDYIAVEDFRREIHTLLNRGESGHQLQRAVYSGKVAPERGQRRDEMKAISGSRPADEHRACLEHRPDARGGREAQTRRTPSRRRLAAPHRPGALLAHLISAAR
jgi:TnpA family transposase